MSHLKVDTHLLKTDSQDLTDELTVIDSKLDDLYNNVKELNGMWKGKANKAFERTFTADYRSFKSFIAKLKADAVRLETESKEYDSCEGRVHSIVSSI